ncbi:hypothetical protein [Paraburkholderia sp. CNPSo 3281]|uniref:hypothetical protein n=1 Tax=Paraburkholderia sp. CNPSo 3281 TaxID=2940933 RepID=UPI0035CCDCD2
MNGDFGERWELLFNTYKPYPCGIVAHPAIDADLAIADRIADASSIDAIVLRCHPLVPELMGNPQPQDGLQARFSAIHGVAAALALGEAQGAIRRGARTCRRARLRHGVPANARRAMRSRTRRNRCRGYGAG